MFIKWYSMNSIKNIWGIRCNSNPNFTRILLVIPYKKHIYPMNISFYAPGSFGKDSALMEPRKKY